MNDSGGQSITLFASAMFVLSGGGYATIAACILSAGTAVVAYVKGMQRIAYIFALVFMIYILGITLYYAIPMTPEHTLSIVKGVRHLGKIAQIVPFVVVLIIMIKLPSQKEQTQ